MLLKQSSAAKALVFFMADSSDHVTGKTGLSPTVKLGKNGGTGAAPSGAVTEIDSTNLPGFYKVAGNATDTNTLGMLALYATASGADPAPMPYCVVAFDPDLAAVGAMASYTQPTGFLAATFPGTVASPTNITAGTITTVTTLTNLPAITAGWLTAAGIAADAITAAKIADGAIDTATFATGTTIPRVTLADTVTTYTGNTVQTGDSFTLVNSATFGLAKLVRATTPANTLDIASTGEAGLDFANVKQATSTTQLVNISVDVQSFLGSSSLIISAIADSVGELDTAAFTTGFVLTSAYDAAKTAASATALAAVQTHGDSTWATATGFSTLTAAGVWANGARTLTASSDPTAAAIADAVWDEARGGHTTTGTFGSYLDAKVSEVSGGGGGGGLSGPSSVTLTFQDANGYPVPLVDFTVHGQGPSQSLTDGTAAFGLEDGDYTISARPTLGTLFADSALTVDGTTALTITGASAVYTPPDDPALCAVSGTLVRPDGEPAAGVQITFTISPDRAPYALDGNLIAGRTVSATTDETGVFAVNLLRDFTYAVRSTSLHFAGNKITLDGSTYDLASLA